MRKIPTQAGSVAIGTREELFRHAVELAAHAHKRSGGVRFHWALAGGSTPMDWYRWSVAERAIPRDLLDATDWFAGDERHVPLAHDDSNFGTADRLLLRPLDVATAAKHPWPVGLPAPECCDRFAETVARMRGPDRAFDLCFLGLGGDGHTASLFPGSPLLRESGDRLFAAVEVPGKGWRLTLTPRGLRDCGSVVVMATGQGKREALSRVLAADGSCDTTPARILREISDRVTWLVDPPAAEGMPEPDGRAGTP